MRNVYLDATERGGDSYLGYDSRYPARFESPYAIFDADRQDWLRAEIRWYWVARLWLWWYGGVKP